MENPSQDIGMYQIGIAAAIIMIVGTLYSGPLGLVAVSSIQPQPEWAGAQTYVENYHPIQSLTYFFGLLLLIGTLLMIVSIHFLSNRGIKSLSALIFTSISFGLISLNYLIQAAYVPALVRDYAATLDPLLSLFAVSNPASLFWAIEMWGYGLLGLGTLFASDFFSTQGIEKAAKIVFVANGIVSLLEALYTSARLEWVLSPAGLVSRTVWNVLYLVLAVLFLVVIVRRWSRAKDDPCLPEP
jgi:hypothetical protein